MTRTPTMWDVPPYSWRSAASIFWRAPLYVVGALLLSVLLFACLQFGLLHMHGPALLRGFVATSGYTLVRTFLFAPAMVAIVGLVFEEPALREDWLAIFRVALLMTAAQLLVYVLRLAEGRIGAVLARHWYSAGGSYQSLYGFAALSAGFAILNAALWVRFALLLPKMARGANFPLRAAWKDLHGYYLAALLASFVTIVPWYVVQWAIRQYVSNPLAIAVLPPDPFHFSLKGDRLLLMLVQGMEVAPLYLLQAALAAWFWRVIAVREAYCALTLTYVPGASPSGLSLLSPGWRAGTCSPDSFVSH